MDAADTFVVGAYESVEAALSVLSFAGFRDLVSLLSISHFLTFSTKIDPSCDCI